MQTSIDNGFTDLSDYGLLPRLMTKIGIQVPTGLEKHEKEAIASKLNFLTDEQANAIQMARLKGHHLNGAIAHFQFSHAVNSVIKKKRTGSGLAGTGLLFMSSGTSQYSKLLNGAADQIMKLDEMFRKPISEIPEVLAKTKVSKGLAKIVGNYPKISFYELAKNATQDKVGKTRFMALFKNVYSEIDSASLKMNRGALHIINDRLGRLSKIFNMNKSHAEIIKVMKSNTVITGLDDAKALLKYANIGKFAVKGCILANVIFSYSNLKYTPKSEAGRVFAGDTGSLIGGSFASGATSFVVGTAARVLIGETLLACGPVGWGVLVLGIGITAAMTYAGSEGGKNLGEQVWDHIIEPHKAAIHNYIEQIDRMKNEEARYGW